MKNKLISAILFTCTIAISSSVCAKHLHSEYYYQMKHCDGKIEYKLPDKTRVDCLTKKYSIEVDYAAKWAEATGQSLHYARMTGKKAGIQLIVEKPSDMRYYHRLMDNIKFYKLPITVWIIKP